MFGAGFKRKLGLINGMANLPYHLMHYSYISSQTHYLNDVKYIIGSLVDTKTKKNLLITYFNRNYKL